MAKQIEITFPNGEVWQVPAEVVAENRANRFAEMGFPVIEADDDELIDHLQNHMDWIEVMKRARLNGANFHGFYDYAEAFDDATLEVKDGQA